MASNNISIRMAMFLLLFFFLVALSVNTSPPPRIVFTDKDMESEENLRHLYEKWVLQYRSNQNYMDPAEHEDRFQLFVENVKYIDSVNKRNLKYTLGLNQFSDMSNDEFAAQRLNPLKRGESRGVKRRSGSLMHSNSNGSFFDINDYLPASIDWSQMGAVNPVRDQGLCGSCWAIAAVQAVEAINFITTRYLFTFSVQQMIDCDEGDDGCIAGEIGNAMQYIEEEGLVYESQYPYTAVVGDCQVDETTERAVYIYSFDTIPSNEAALQESVVEQPVAVNLAVSAADWQSYSSGVYTGPCNDDINHNALLVGYDNYTDGTPYWKVKNSWGATWGQDGYILMQRGVEEEMGLCQIANASVVPVQHEGD